MQKISADDANEFLAFDTKTLRFKTFTSNGRDKPMDQVREIEFVNRFYQNPMEQGEEKKFTVTTEPELMGTWSKKPILFALHPKFAEGKHYMMTLDYKTVLKRHAVGSDS